MNPRFMRRGKGCASWQQGLGQSSCTKLGQLPLIGARTWYQLGKGHLLRQVALKHHHAQVRFIASNDRGSKASVNAILNQSPL